MQTSTMPLRIFTFVYFSLLPFSRLPCFPKHRHGRRSIDRIGNGSILISFFSIMINRSLLLSRVLLRKLIYFQKRYPEVFVTIIIFATQNVLVLKKMRIVMFPRTDAFFIIKRTKCLYSSLLPLSF